MIDKISPTIRNTLLRKSYYNEEDDDDEDEDEEEDGSGDGNDSDYEDDE
jgi:hypothetical protein